ncbi:unnamed protein product [Pleuronectes platessa]|uniref:Neurotrophin-4 n=1 Tax=Pleuronectes platessa TaxID=8262 RepID=A0A9N7VM37_PLEPL|nr:unnamed protein product [Pleuronectes platessa]
MHWLPLVAMVIASALPFPHSPLSRITAATTEPGSDNRREHRHDPAARLAAPTSNYNFHGNASQTNFDMAAALGQHPNGQNLQSHKDYVKSSAQEETSMFKVDNQGTYQSNSNSGSDGKSSVSLDVPTEGRTLRDREQGSRRGQAEQSLNVEAGLGLGIGLDNILEGDEMFLDAHPRVLFSPSLSPPEHPPLLLMLETGPLEEVGGVEEQEDMDGHIEGHGDQAIDRSTTPSWADSSRGNSAVAHPVKRDKRSHPIDRRRGEKSVCEAESVWVTDKKTATDSHGQKVTILQEIQTQTGPLKQFFYETRCRQPEPQSKTGKPRSLPMGVAGSGCLGVDKRQWLSECKPKQSFVRALTKDANNRTGWRWIRIDSSCVCVLLSRTNQAPGRDVLMRQGRG